MFNTIDKNKTYQCPSEFGLYKCEETDECYSVRKKQTKFGFGYLVVLLTSVIVLSSVCVVVYSYVFNTNTKLQSRPIHNFTQEDNNTTLIPFINISFHHEFTNENIQYNNSEISSKDDEPVALKYGSGNPKRYFFPESNIPRPFIYEIRDPKPTGFQVSDNQQKILNVDNAASENTPKPIRTRVRNIQDIIKLLSNHGNPDQDTENSNNKVNFRNQKRLRNKQPKRKTSLPYVTDPFFPYKPQNPSDINLLATNSFRFAPTVQLESKKKPIFEQYPNYERPIDSKDSIYPEQPISVTLDLSQNKRLKKRKPINYPNGFTNLYNQNQYFNPGNRFQPQQFLNKQPNYYKPWNNWNLAPNANRNKGRNGVQTIKGNSPMIVHLNLYPKKRKPNDDTEIIGESSVHHNCTNNHNNNNIEYYDFAQIKNTSEFNQLLENMRHQSSSGPIYNDKVTTNDNYYSNNDGLENLFRVKDTTYPQNDKPEISSHNFVNKPNTPNVEIQKSIGFTIINPNFSTPHLSGDEEDSESRWHPITMDGKFFPEDDDDLSNDRDDRVVENGADKDDHYGLEVGEVNESSDETVTLPLPQDLFQKYFNTKATTMKYNDEWDPNVIQTNPNLVNHRASF